MANSECWLGVRATMNSFATTLQNTLSQILAGEVLSLKKNVFNMKIG
jgi:hypothetical protein